MIDDLINNSNSKNDFDVEAFKKKKKEQKDYCYQIISESLEEFKTNPDFVKQYLDMQSKLDVYSPRNVMLISKQLPTATQLKEWKKWKEANVSFKEKYPKKILILDPRDPYQTQDGRTIRSFTAKEVIDISETNLRPTTKTYDKKMILQALLHNSTIPFKTVDELESGKICEWNTDDKAIYVARNENLDIVIPAIANELAKINIYENTEEIDNDKAQCVSYMLCKKYGIDAPVDVDKVFNKYKDMDTQDIANHLTSMKDVLQDMNSNIGQYLDEKNKDNRSKEQER